MLNAPEYGIDVTDKLRVRKLGPVPYVPTWHAMQQLTQDRDAETVDEIWLLEHPPVFTQGQAGKAEHLLAPGNIPVVQVDRGGQVTYHGPGQLMVYLLVDLARKKIGVRDLVTAIEQSVVEALAEWNIEATPRKEAPGVYVGGAKIASLGLRIRRGRSFHGVALNVSMDMRPFGLINPCGYAGMAMTQMADFHPKVTLENAADQLLSALCGHLRYPSVEFTSAKPDCWVDRGAD